MAIPSISDLPEAPSLADQANFQAECAAWVAAMDTFTTEANAAIAAINNFTSGAAILGTVSQSGGTPTGAVLERGTNGNGYYERLASGLQIVHTESVTLTYVNASFLGFTWTFPASFVASSKPVGQLVLPSTTATDYANCTFQQVGPLHMATGTAAAQFLIPRISGTTNFPTNATISNVRLSAIGRWSNMT